MSEFAFFLGGFTFAVVLYLFISALFDLDARERRQGYLDLTALSATAEGRDAPANRVESELSAGGGGKAIGPPPPFHVIKGGKK